MLADRAGLALSKARGKPLWMWAVGIVFIIVVFAAVFEHPKTQSYASDTFHRISNSLTIQGSGQRDTFKDFVKGEECNVTTSELHHFFEPYCETKEELLAAMTGGGRHGWDQPYATLGCNMRWFSTEEICQVMKRFDRITFVGDSLMRQLMIAMHIFLREDLVSGARQTWHEGNPEGQDCHCRTLFSMGSKCFWWEAINTDEIWEKDPASMKCDADTGRFSFFMLPYWKIKEEDVDFFVKETLLRMPKNESKTAYIFGQGAWNAYNSTETQYWIEQMEDGVRDKVPSFFDAPRLFITPSANGWRKPIQFAYKGNNILVLNHAREIVPYVLDKGYDHLGMFNLTVQSESPDGTHASLESALVEAMMVLNWLAVA